MFLCIYASGYPSLEFVFDNYKLNASIAVPGVQSGYYGFEMSSSNPIRYFVTHLGQRRIFVFDENWNYVSNKSISSSIYYITQGGNYYYITASSTFLKTDLQFNILITYNSYGGYCGLYYNSTGDSIFVAPASLKVIHVFNFNLALTDTIAIAPYNPWSINAYNDQLYVGTSNGTILVIVNKQIIKQFDGCNGQNINLNSILFDQFDNIAAACSIVSPLYLLKTNGTYLNKNILTVDYPYYIGFDSKSRLVVVTTSVIFVYN
jgi:hypothetical protein